MGGGIWPFSEKLHKTGNGTLGKYHAVFCQLRENRVSGLYDIQSIPDTDGIWIKIVEQRFEQKFENFNNAMDIARIATLLGTKRDVARYFFFPVTYIHSKSEF